MGENAAMNSKTQTLALSLLIALGVVATSAQAAAVHATPQPEAPAVTAKPHLKAQQGAKKKPAHKKTAAKKKSKAKKKTTGKHTQTQAAGHKIH